MTKEYSCPKCGAKYDDIDELNSKFLRIPGGKTIIAYYCPKCGAKIDAIY